jgi:hypothetical protein
MVHTKWLFKLTISILHRRQNSPKFLSEFITHPDPKLFFTSYFQCCGSLFGIIFSGSRLLMYFILTATPDLPDRTWANVICMTLGIINSMSISALLTLMFLGGIERHMATIWIHHYESKKRSFGFILIAIAVSFGFCLNFWISYFQMIISFATALSANISHVYFQFDLKTTYQTCVVVEYCPQVGLLSFTFGFFFCSSSAIVSCSK